MSRPRRVICFLRLWVFRFQHLADLLSHLSKTGNASLLSFRRHRPCALASSSIIRGSLPWRKPQQSNEIIHCIQYPLIYVNSDPRISWSFVLSFHPLFRTFMYRLRTGSTNATWGKLGPLNMRRGRTRVAPDPQYFSYCCLCHLSSRPNPLVLAHLRSSLKNRRKPSTRTTSRITYRIRGLCAGE